MPSARAHIAQAQRNEEVQALLSRSITSESLQWQIVTLFYAALHRVEAGFATLNMHNASHQEREAAMGRVAQFRPVFHLYRQLRDDSEAARYRLWRPRQVELNQDVAIYARLINYLRTVFGI
jgi:hypothetical protein